MNHSKSKKILIFSNYYFPNIIGGAEISTQLLAESLLENNFIPIIVTLGEKDNIRFMNGIKIYEISNCNIKSISEIKNSNIIIKGIWHLIDIYNIFIKRKIKKIYEIEKPSITHTNNLQGFSPIVWRISKKLNVPVIHTIRDYYLLCPNTQLFSSKGINPNNLICRLFSFYKKKLTKHVDKVVGISEFVLNFHLKFGYFQNSLKEVIPNSINKIQAKIFFNDPPVFGLVGRLEKAKGVELVLAIFKNELPHLKLYVFGTTQDYIYKKYLMTKYKSKNIIFKGQLEKDEIYKSIDVTIVPSIWNEPFGRVVIESFSYGVPVIASDKGGLKELIVQWQNGITYNGDYDELFRSIKYFEKNRKLLRQFSKFSNESSKLYLTNNIITKYVKVINILTK